MKTLDEVIKAVHHCGLLTGFDDTYEYDGGCPYEDCSKCEQKRMLGKDTLHYLKEYKEMKEHLACLDTATLHGEDTTKYRRRNNDNA